MSVDIIVNVVVEEHKASEAGDRELGARIMDAAAKFLYYLLIQGPGSLFIDKVAYVDGARRNLSGSPPYLTCISQQQAMSVLIDLLLKYRDTLPGYPPTYWRRAETLFSPGGQWYGEKHTPHAFY